MDEVPLGPVRQSPGLGFVIRYRYELEVLGDRFPPVHVRAERPGNGCYIRPRFLGRAGWPTRGPRVCFQGWGRAAFTWRGP
jgi:hypothetical protein